MQLLKQTGLFLFFMFLCQIMLAQKSGKVLGQLIDSTETPASPIADATISILNLADSSLVSYILSDKEGKFELKNIDWGSYIFLVTHVNFLQYKKDITLSVDTAIVDFEKIFLASNEGLLDEFVVQSQAPIVVKGDTIQYNTSGFKTQPNATVEDLLKKLPGVEVDTEGNIKAQGENITKIYLDGKEFFGNDPKFASRNLTADMLESVQIYDDMSDQAKFTEIDDGSRVRTINLKTKKGQNKGHFGRNSVGYGSSDRYDANISLNRFSNTQRISAVFNANNINRSGSGDRGGSGGIGGSGINRTLGGGLNYTDEWGKNIKITGSYNYGSTNSLAESESLRRTTYKDRLDNDSLTIRTQLSSNTNRNQNHRFNVRLEYQIDSLTSLLYTPSGSLQRSQGNSVNTSSTTALANGMEFLATDRTSQNANERDGFNLNNNLLLRRKFKKRGRTLTIGWNNAISKSDTERFTLSNNSFYDPDGNVIRVINQNQRTTQNTNSHNNSLTTTYTEPIGKNKYVEINYAYNNNKNTSERAGFNEDNGKYETPNLALTNNFDNSFVSHRYGTNFRLVEKTYNFQMGLGVQHATIKNNNYQALTDKDSLIKQNYVNLFPTANLNITPRRSKNIRISYNGRTNQPNVDQLQTVPDVTDTLNIRIGNPDLKQEFSHSLNASYNNMNPTTFRFINVNINASTISNKIITNIQNIQPGITMNKPENINGVWNTNAQLTLGFPLKNKWQGSNFSVTNNIGYNQNASMLDFKKNLTNTFNVAQGLGVSINKDKIDFTLRANLTYNIARYELNSRLNENYWTQNYSTAINYNLPKNFFISTNFDYLVNTGRASGFNQSIPLWNAAISRYVFKQKTGEIRFSVNDLLNKNESIRRVNNQNYVEDSRNMVLRRYFMVSFVYNLRRMGSNNNRRFGGEGEREIRRGGNQGGGQMRGGMGPGRRN